MRYWHVSHDPKTHGHRHRASAGFGNALLTPALAYFFDQLGVSVSIWEHGAEWIPIHVTYNVSAFETAHGRDRERNAYDARQFAKVRAEKVARTSSHAGFTDLFVPIVVRGVVVGIVVAGPVSASRPTSTDVLERWRSLTGREGHPSDPEFAAYLSTSLATLVLAGDALRTFERLLECFARLMAGEGRAAELMNRAEALRAELELARWPERCWEAVRNVVDERQQRAAFSQGATNMLRNLGVARRPDHVMVGLTLSRAPGAEGAAARSAVADPDAVDEAVRRDAFQRAVTELARTDGNALAGRVGDHGVVVLSGTAGTLRHKQRKARRLAERAAELAERYGLTVHFGLARADSRVPLAIAYRAALAAAEGALVRRLPLVSDAPDARPARPALRSLREQLVAAVEQDPALVGARFDAYLEAVLGQCGYRIESARVHLEVGFERMTAALDRRGALDPRSMRALSEATERAADGAATVSELFAAYRRAARDVADAVQRPTPARRDRSLRAAIEFMHQHYGAPLSRNDVARRAGFAPGYFSELFKARERVTFEEYLRGLRLERAKQLLLDTELEASRIAELSGFASPQYFSRVFTHVVGMTPLQFRTRARNADASERAKLAQSPKHAERRTSGNSRKYNSNRT